jgi:hypothetical protein
MTDPSGYSLLLVFYLQSQHPEIRLPVVDSLFQNMMAEPNISALVQRLNSLPFMETIPSTFGTSEVNSVGALLAGFFEFYAQRFNVEDDVVSVRTGAVLSKTTKWSHPVSWRISIEDPFELAHDVGRVVFHKAGQELLGRELTRAFDMIHSGQRWEDICQHDEMVWSASAACYICYGSDHTTRNCSQLSRHRMNGKTGASVDPGALAFLTDCWYCGEQGHYKANCPMLFFRDIPLPCAFSSEVAGSPTDIGVFMAPSPEKPSQRYHHKQQQQQQQQQVSVLSESTGYGKFESPKLSPRRSKTTGLAVWERGASVAVTRPPKRKKRTRHGSTSSLSPPILSPASSTSSLSAWSPPETKRQQRHGLRQQQQQQQSAQAAPTLHGHLTWSGSTTRAGGKKCAVAVEAAAIARRSRGAEKILCRT